MSIDATSDGFGTLFECLKYLDKCEEFRELDPDDIVAAVAELGPMTAGQIEAQCGKKGPWWDRSDTKWATALAVDDDEAVRELTLRAASSLGVGAEPTPATTSGWRPSRASWR